jgi:hypothetical protein
MVAPTVYQRELLIRAAVINVQQANSQQKLVHPLELPAKTVPVATSLIRTALSFAAPAWLDPTVLFLVQVAVQSVPQARPLDTAALHHVHCVLLDTTQLRR